LPIIGATLAATASAYVAAKSGGRVASAECEAGEGGSAATAPLTRALAWDPQHFRMHRDVESGVAILARSTRPLGDEAELDLRPQASSARRWWRHRWPRGRGDRASWWGWLGRTFFAIARGVEIAVRLSPLLVLAPTAALVSRLLEGASEEEDPQPPSTTDANDLQSSANWASNLAWRYALHSLQSLGPAFVKLGQWAATRRDLFPVHACVRLSKLHDAARVHAAEHTRRALAEAFGEDYEARGLRVALARDDDAGGFGVLGSGSAAQVHRGTLTTATEGGATTRKDVAIKVLHPHARRLVERDLALMRHVADVIDRCLPLDVVKMLSLPRAASNFADVVERQVDLRVEGRNLIAFRDNFGLSRDDGDDARARRRGASPPPAITFPRPEPGWISERVLVEEHAGDEAFPISRLLADDTPEGRKARKELAGPLLRAFLKMVFVDNFIHADLHPGNVLVRPTPDAPLRGYTLVFLDAGLATSLRPNDRKNLRDLFKAVVLNDGYAAGELMVERARHERCTSLPGGGGKHAFATGVAEIVAEFHDRRKQGLTLGAVRVGALLGKVLDLCRRYGVEIDPAMSSVVVSMLVLEGLGRSLDPDLNLMTAAVPFLLGRGKV